MQNNLLVQIKWMYYSIKEQYKYINSFFNRISQNPIYIRLIDKEIKHYKISLTLFKKSFNEFENAFNSSFSKEKIYLIKEVYLRRCLINLKQGTDLLVNDKMISQDMFYQDLINLFIGLINSLKELGMSLEKV